MTVELRYETAPELVGGIELSANGRKFAWSISDYLVSLEHGVDELLKDAAPASSAAPTPQAPAETPAADAGAKPAATAKSA